MDCPLFNICNWHCNNCRDTNKEYYTNCFNYKEIIKVLKKVLKKGGKE